MLKSGSKLRIAVTVGVVAVLAGCGSSSSTTSGGSGSTSSAASGGSAASTSTGAGQLVIYSNSGQAFFQPVLNAFAKAYPSIKISYSDVEDPVSFAKYRFEPAEQVTIKLEGSALRGYQTISLAGIREPKIIGALDVWTGAFLKELASRIDKVLALDPSSYQVDLRCYGADAVLGPAEPQRARGHEIAAVLKVRANDQGAATAVAKLANPLMLHMPLPGMAHLPTYAFLTSPAEIELGPAYEFVLNHVVAVDSESELFRTTLTEVSNHD